MQNNKKVMLMILDGWGYGKHDTSNAVEAAQTPFFNSLIEKYPNSKLQASGEFVGLPDGQMGNSEVGHMNLGAGRIVYQELGRINKAIIDDELKSNDTLVEAFNYAKANHKKTHFIGLLSDGGVHSHINHLIGLVKAATEAGLRDVFIHAFLDGRDTDPNSGKGHLETLQTNLSSLGTGEIASAIGRYYAMDRDNRWERVQQAYDLLVHGKGATTTDIIAAVEKSYQNGVTDEFVKPIVKVNQAGQPVTKIEDGDVVICYNFRTDRAREITTALTQKPLPEYGMHPLTLHYVTMTTYDETFANINVVFKKDDITQTLGEILEQNGKTQVRIAETEKYPHVTFFFSGGREKEFINERRLLIPSPKVATYDLQPEMSAQGIADTICSDIESNQPDFICLNFANPDMVGHTGVFEAVVKAVEKVDQCAQQTVECGLRNGYSFIILADHGNAEFMINGDGSVNTAHTTNLVPCILIDKDHHSIKDGKLGDVAPTILKLLGAPVPEAMTGTPLV